MIASRALRASSEQFERLLLHGMWCVRRIEWSKNATAEKIEHGCLVFHRALHDFRDRLAEGHHTKLARNIRGDGLVPSGARVFVSDEGDYDAPVTNV